VREAEEGEEGGWRVLGGWERGGSAGEVGEREIIAQKRVGSNKQKPVMSGSEETSRGARRAGRERTRVESWWAAVGAVVVMVELCDGVDRFERVGGAEERGREGQK
jgi:hypothetical protein